jgi:hypothetical protein
MKSKLLGLSLSVSFLAATPLVHGTEILKLSTGALNSAASWNGGVLPTTADIGVFDSSTVPTGAGNSFDGNAFFVGGYKITDIAGPLSISGATTYIYAGGVIDMSAATADVSFTGTLRTNGPSSGANYTVTIASGRTLTLNNQTFSRNAYTMPINGGGTLLVNGLTDGGGTNRVAYDVTGTGTTIGGNGSWEPSNTNGGYGIRLASGTAIAPGSGGVGTMTINGAHSGQTILTMLDGSGFKFELGTGGTFGTPSANSDLLSFTNMVAGDVVFGGTSTFDFLGTGSAGVFKLLDTSLDATTWSGLTLTGQEITGGLSVSNLAGGLTGKLYMGDGGSFGEVGDIYLQVTAVPEPGAYGIALAGLLFGVIACRRRRVPQG